MVLIVENWFQAPSVCRYFLNGNCRYGDFCRNSHIVQNDSAFDNDATGGTNQEENNNNNQSNTSFTGTNEVSRNWIDAPEFIPRYISQNTSQPTNEDQGASRCDRHFTTSVY